MSVLASHVKMGVEGWKVLRDNEGIMRSGVSDMDRNGGGGDL